MKPIFLFSLPRSGSTLLQRMLATHPEIATTSEPWLLLPFLYALRTKGVKSEYNHQDMALAFEDFCEQLPGKKADYYSSIRDLALDLYSKASGGNSQYFLDKTPRYHLIIDEIHEIFPEAKFIILWRNPVAVAASMMETWNKGRWNLYHFEVDLYTGLSNLCDTAKKHTDKIYNIRFEDLVGNPEGESQKLLDFLQLAGTSSEAAEFSSVSLEGRMGDPTGVKQYKTVSTDSLQKWQSTMANPWRKHWSKQYLNWIGQDRIELMGYDFNELHEELSHIKIGKKHFINDIARLGYRAISTIRKP